MKSPIVAVGYIFFPTSCVFPVPEPWRQFMAAVPVALNRLIECCGVNFKQFQAFIENAGV